MQCTGEHMKDKLGITTLGIDEPLLFEIGSSGRTAVPFPDENSNEPDLNKSLPPGLVRGEIQGFPEISQPELVRYPVSHLHIPISLKSSLRVRSHCCTSSNSILLRLQEWTV